MYSRLFAKKFYYQATTKTQIRTQFDYDTTGELDTERLFTDEPCFAHPIVQKETEFHRKTVIWNGGQACHIPTIMDLVNCGFLVRYVEEHGLVPLINENQIKDAQSVNIEALKVLLQRHQLKPHECIVLDVLSDRDDLYDLCDAFQISYDNREPTTEAGRLHVYVEKGFVAFSMLNEGELVNRVTDIKAPPELYAPSLHKSLFQFMTKNWLINISNIRDYPSVKACRYLTQTIDAHEFKRSMDLHPNLEMLELADVRRISGKLPDLSLLKLKALSITTEKYVESSLLFNNIKQLLTAAPFLHTSRLVISSSRSSDSLQIGSCVKLLTFSDNLLRMIQVPKKNALLGIEVSAGVYEAKPRRSFVSTDDLKSLVQRCPSLEVLNLSQIELTEVPNFESIKNLKVIYSPATSQEIAIKLASLQTRSKDRLQLINKELIVKNLAAYHHLRFGVYMHSSEMTRDIYEGLACSFFHLCSTTTLKTPEAVQAAWADYLDCLAIWDISDLGQENSDQRRAYDRLLYEVHKKTKPYQQALLSLENVWRTPPDQALLLCDVNTKVHLHYQEGFWYYFDPETDIRECQIFLQGSEESLQALIEQRFGDNAVYLTTQQPLRIDLNPHLSSDIVVAYIKKKRGLQNLLYRGDTQDALSYIQVDTLSRADLTPLLENSLYTFALRIQPGLVRRMLERYQIFEPDFVIPETDIIKASYQPLLEDLQESPPVQSKRSSSMPKDVLRPPEFLEKKRIPVQHAQSVLYTSIPLSDDLKDKQRWLQRSGSGVYPQRLLLEKLQDYLVLQYGMTDETWAVLNALEGGIETAIAFCFADYWMDPQTVDPMQIIFGWKDACAPFQYWKDATRHPPRVGSKLHEMLQMLWFYSYPPSRNLHDHPYQMIQKVSDLGLLLTQYPTQPLVLSDEKYVVTCFYREGIWYYFSPNDVSGEPQCFRCGDEQRLRKAILSVVTGDLVVASRQPLAFEVGDEVTDWLGFGPKFERPVTEHPIFLPPRLPKRADFDPLPLVHSTQLQGDPLFSSTVLPDETHAISADDPNLNFLCHCSMDRIAALPAAPEPTTHSDQITSPISLQAFDLDILGREGQNILLKASHPKQLDLYLDHLLTTPQAKSRGIWIVNSFRDLQCAVKDWVIYADNHCEEKEAPAGDCFDFITNHDAPIIAVNVSALSNNELLQMNPLWDEPGLRSVDNIPIAKRALVLSLQNGGDPDAYTGNDFISRHDEKPIEISDDLQIPALLPHPERSEGSPDVRDDVHQQPDDVTIIEIDFYHSFHWKNYLYGKINPGISGVQFEPGVLLEKTYSGPLKIVLKNAPTELAEFRQALYRIWQNKRIGYHGRVMQLPEHLYVEYAEGYSFDVTCDPPQFTRGYSDDYDATLNPSTLSQFFVQYHFTSHGPVTMPGILASHTGQTLTVYVTRDLSVEDWSKLWHQAQRYRCRMVYILARDVHLPSELSRQIPAIREIDATEGKPFPYGTSTDGYDRIISISGLSANDFFYKVYRDENKILREQICETWEFLRTQEARVLLVGACDPKLMDKLWDVIQGRGYLHNGRSEHPIGTLDLLDPKIDLTCLTQQSMRRVPIPDELPPDIIDHSDDDSLAIVKKLDTERHHQVTEAFQKSRVVCILGHTDAGKSYYLQTYPGAIFNDIARWIREGGTLVIDEANLKQINWSQFESLLWDPPSILHEGTYHLLSEKHQIAVAMNPAAYSDERQTPDWLNKYAELVIFSGFPNAYLYHKFLLPILGDCQGRELMLGRLFLSVYQMVKTIDPQVFSVRELQYMAYLFKAAPHVCPDDDQACAWYHAYQSAMQVLTEAQKADFQTAFIQTWRNCPDPKRHYPEYLQWGEEKRFELVESHHVAYAALEDLFSVRQYKILMGSSGGLPGFILEGPPGTAKSLFIKQFLLSKGLKQDQDFYYLPAKWSPIRKKEILLSAFHAGKIVIMEEFNASEMIEDVLNAVLSGVDIFGQAAHTSGFLVLGTQNPRQKLTSLAVQRRMVHAQFLPYTLQEMFSILTKQGISLPIAYDCATLTLRDQQIGFRDVYKLAHKRQAHAILALETSLQLPAVFWRLLQVFSPLSMTDAVLLRAMHARGWQDLLYQAEDEDYYFHDYVFRKIKKHGVFHALRIRLSENDSVSLRAVFQQMTHPRIVISETIFAHIELDMEMPGLAGIQAESEDRIFGYFGQFISDRTLTDRRLLAFSQAVAALRTQNGEMASLDDKSTRSVQSFHAYCLESAKKIQADQPGQNLFFTGGWRNPSPGSSHSMIYQFERTDDGLRFYIYNAGAGLAEHEKMSTTQGERYFPVKVYDIPNPLSQKELLHLIQRLLLPKLVDHPARTQHDEIVDATKLYRNIEKVLEHMSARQVLASTLWQAGVTTKGVMAGACTLSIQQLLNCYLNDPQYYRGLIFDLKYAALQDFIQTYPAPRPRHINQLLFLAIENNLKIVSTMQADKTAQAHHIAEAADLRTFKKKIAAESWYDSTDENQVAQTEMSYAIDWIPAVTKTPPDTTMQPEKPLGELMQAERDILAFADTFGSTTSGIKMRLTTLSRLEALQSRYQKLYVSCYGESQLPHLFVMQSCLLHACAQLAPELKECFDKELGSFFHGYRHCAHLATHDPDLDHRLGIVMQQYPYQPLDYDQWLLNKYLQILRNSDEQCSIILNDLYLRKYATNNQPKHIAIREKRLQALYVLLEELENDGRLKEQTQLDPKPFQSLIDHIQTQMRVENIIVQSFHFLLQRPMPCMISPKILYQINKFKMATQLSIAAPNQHPYAQGSSSLVHQQYLMAQDVLARQALQADVPRGTVWQSKNKARIKENDIQLMFNQDATHSMVKIDFFIRELSHLRLVPEHQIMLTIDYFLDEPQHMKDRANQQYLEANIFQPSLLSAYRNDPAFIAKWDELMRAAMRECQDEHGELSHGSLYVLRLQFYFNRYFKDVPRLQANVTTLNRWIEREERRDVLSTLHQYRFLTILALQDTSLYSDAYVSYVYMQAVDNPQMVQDIVYDDLIQRVQTQFKQWLSRPQDLPRQWMSKTLQRYPELAQASDKVELITGKLYRGDIELRPIPLHWRSAPILESLGVTPGTVCGVVENENAMIFGLPKVFARAIKVNDRWVFHKKWRVADQAAWYEWCPLSTAQVHRYGLDPEEHGYPTIKHHLPLWLTDDQTQAWVHLENPHTVLFVQDKQIRYLWQGETSFQMIEDERPVGTLLALPQEQRAHLAHFEDPQFILHAAMRDYNKIYFERYGLELRYDPDSYSLQHLDTQTYLAQKSTSPFAPNVACLMFTKHGKVVECRVPVQPFYVLTHEVQTVANYYPLVHDISAHLPAKHLSQHWEQRKIGKKEEPIWQYRHSEKFVTFRLVDGKPKADCAENALYLCYIYLATHDLEQAWCVLNEISDKGGITGSFAELTYLEWILHKLPETDVYTEHSEQRNKSEALAQPGYIACQLKALALFTQGIQQGKQLEIPEAPVLDRASGNAHYAALHIQTLQKLYNNFPNLIAEKYTRFQNIACYLPEALLLDDDACHSLLAYIYAKGSPALGALGHARLQLSLKALLQLEHHLLAFQRKRGSTWTMQEERRLLAVQHALQTQEIVRKQTTVLEYVRIDISLPNHFSETVLRDSYDCLRLRQSPNLLAEDGTYSDEQASAALSSMISTEDLIRYLPNLLRIAIRGASYDPEAQQQRHALFHFCKATLRAARHISLNHQETPIPYLANVLYRLLENPGCLGMKTEWNWDALIQVLQPLSVPDIYVAQAKDVYAEPLSNAMDMVSALRRHVFQKESIVTLPVDVALWQICPLWRDAYIQVMPYKRVGTDQTVGEAIYRHIQEKRRIASLHLQDVDSLVALQQAALAKQMALEDLLAEKWAAIELLAHQMPQDGEEAQLYLNELSASKRHLATEQDLLKAYLHQDRSGYYAITALTHPEEVDRLHANLHEYVTLAVHRQKMQRLQEAIKEGNPFDIAEILTQESPDAAQRSPSLMLFQYLDNKMLWPTQADALKRMLQRDPEDNLRFRNIVEKMVMGKGKSKVVTPILVQEKATGNNLVIVEVPHALLSTQHADMNQLSRTLFHQTAHRFEFSRESDCSAKRLEEIHELFVRISTKKDYLVTTGESMQALHLKYRELLLSKPKLEKDFPEWRQQLIWAEKIVQLLKETGDVLIDEVHVGLWQKKKMNYTFGTTLPVDVNMVEYSIQLYEFLDRYPDGRRGGPVLINRLLRESSSPLYNIVRPSLLPLVGDYLNNRCADVPAEIRDLAPELRNKLAFYKEQALLLPKTSARKYKEKYGPSKKPKKTAAEQVRAIPYRANNTPNERSRFGHVMETINYTIQGLLQQGLDDRLLADAIQAWQAKALQMMKESPDIYREMNDTPLAQELNTFLAGTGLSLQTIDVTIARDRAVLVPLYRNTSLIFRVLQDYVLPSTPKEQAVLHADAYDHVDLYHTVQGLTGTPWNHTTYKNVVYDEATTLGNDGYIQEVIQSKVHSLRTQGFDGLSEFISGLNFKPTTHALIDICARFAGFDAPDVAKALAHQFSQQRSQIKYVLYFNDDDILCALPVAEKGAPIILGTSDSAEICRKLGDCSLDECFTYYDQPRAIGTDLTQTATANAIVLMDEETHLQSFLQGCCRMRGLEKEQTIDLVVPPNLQDVSLPDLLKKMQMNEALQVLEDNVVASFDKLENIIRLDLEHKIMAIDVENVDKKHRYMLAFERFFMDKPEAQDLFAKYGGMYHKDNTQQLLERHKRHLLKEWGQCLESVRLSLDKTERNTMIQAMDGIIQTSETICPKEIFNREGKRQYGQEVEEQTELELELEQLDEYYDASLVAVPHQDWDPKAARRLSEWCGNMPDFSNNLWYSPNYAQVYAGQPAQMDKYIKPVHLVYFEKKRGTLTACLITQAEALEIKRRNPNGEWWVGTVRHSVLAGHRPAGVVDDPAYQKLIEQICYFNGNINTLIDPRKPCLWLSEDSDKKIDFYHRQLLPQRGADPVRGDAKRILQTQSQSRPAISSDQSTTVMSWLFNW